MMPADYRQPWVEAYIYKKGTAKCQVLCGVIVYCSTGRVAAAWQLIDFEGSLLFSMVPVVNGGGPV